MLLRLTWVSFGDCVRHLRKTGRKMTRQTLLGAITQKNIFNTILNRHKKAKTVILVNDPYDLKESIKDSEHARRESHVKYIHGSKNIFIRPLDKLPNSKQLAAFFTNKDNKIRLQSFLKDEFAILSISCPQEIIYSVQNYCTNLQTKERCPQFECQIAEADIVIFYIASVLWKQEFCGCVIIDAEDTDVIVQACHFAHKYSRALGIMKKNKFYCCKQLCSAEVANDIIQLHVLTGSDATSGFFGHGKKAAWKGINQKTEACQLLKSKIFLPIFFAHCLYCHSHELQYLIVSSKSIIVQVSGYLIGTSAISAVATSRI